MWHRRDSAWLALQICYDCSPQIFWDWIHLNSLRSRIVKHRNRIFFQSLIRFLFKIKIASLLHQLPDQHHHYHGYQRYHTNAISCWLYLIYDLFMPFDRRSLRWLFCHNRFHNILSLISDDAMHGLDKFQVLEKWLIDNGSKFPKLYLKVRWKLGIVISIALTKLWTKHVCRITAMKYAVVIHTKRFMKMKS